MNQNPRLRRRRLTSARGSWLGLCGGILAAASCAPRGAVTIELGDLGPREGALCLKVFAEKQFLQPQKVEAFRRQIKLAPPDGAAPGTKLTLMLTQLDEQEQCLSQGHGCLIAETEISLPADGSAVSLQRLPQPRCPIDVVKTGHGRICALAAGQDDCDTSLNCPSECDSPRTDAGCFRQCRGYFAEPVTLRAYPDKNQVFSCWGTPPCAQPALETVSAAPGETVNVLFSELACTSSWCPMSLPEGATNNYSAIWGRDPNHVWAVGDAGTVLFWNGAVWRRDDSGVPPVALNGIWVSAAPAPLTQWIVGNQATVLQRDSLSGSWVDKTAEAKAQLGGMNDLYAVTGQTLPSGTHIAIGGISALMIYQTENAANNPWSVQKTPTLTFNGIAADSLDILAAGTMGTAYHYTASVWNKDVAASGDPSITWSSVWNQSDLSILAGAGSATGFSIRIKSAAGSWFVPPADPRIPMNTNWFGSWAADPRDLWFVGSSGTVARFDGTAAWSPVTSPDTQSVLRAIWGSTKDGLDVWVAVQGKGIWRYIEPK